MLVINIGRNSYCKHKTKYETAVLSSIRMGHKNEFSTANILYTENKTISIETVVSSLRSVGSLTI